MEHEARVVKGGASRVARPPDLGRAVGRRRHRASDAHTSRRAARMLTHTHLILSAKRSRNSRTHTDHRGVYTYARKHTSYTSIHTCDIRTRHVRARDVSSRRSVVGGAPRALYTRRSAALRAVRTRNRAPSSYTRTPPGRATALRARAPRTPRAARHSPVGARSLAHAH